jgi:hypothetical protein
MTVWWPVDGEEPSPDEVKEVLVRGLREHFGRPVRIVELRSKFLGEFISAHTHPIARVRLTLGSGEQLTVIFKRLHSQPYQDVRRRILIHQRLLTDVRLDAPTVYATACDGVRGRYWLFCEDVGDLELTRCDVSVWPAAYRWLARMHAAYYGREEELRALGCLDEHSPAFYRFFARPAREVLQRYAGRRQLVRFERLMTRWFSVSVAYLTRHTRTLVHGDLYCKNIMVQPGPRIRPIDWDYAAIGVAGWDMAQLVAGWGPEKRSHFIKVYLDEFALRDTTVVTLDRRVFERTLAHCEIMRVLQALSWWEGPYENLAFVDGKLDEMEIACAYLDNEGSG